MPAYLVVRAEVTDWPQYQEYMKVTPGIVAKFGGRFIARGGEVVTLEGPPETRRVVIIEFPSLKQAETFYQSEEYTQARQLRAAAGTAQFIAVEGISS
jgi:uncharacterized protein (DUF1330 family)